MPRPKRVDLVYFGMCLHRDEREALDVLVASSGLSRNAFVRELILKALGR